MGTVSHERKSIKNTDQGCSIRQKLKLIGDGERNKLPYYLDTLSENSIVGNP
jgi:hypothetical protein